MILFYFILRYNFTISPARPDLIQLIESETRVLCADALARAHALLAAKAAEHEFLAKALLDHEDLTAEEMKIVVTGRPVPPRTL